MVIQFTKIYQTIVRKLSIAITAPLYEVSSPQKKLLEGIAESAPSNAHWWVRWMKMKSCQSLQILTETTGFIGKRLESFLKMNLKFYKGFKSARKLN